MKSYIDYIIDVISIKVKIILVNNIISIKLYATELNKIFLFLLSTFND